MNQQQDTIKCLVIDDDEEFLDGFEEYINSNITACNLEWDKETSFTTGLDLINSRQYGLVVSDVYSDSRQQFPTGTEIVNLIHKKKYVPIILISGGSVPADFSEKQFIRFVDKSERDKLPKTINEIISTNIIQAKKRVFDDIEKDATGFLWDFLDKKWDIIKDTSLNDPDLMYRFIRRRMAQLLSNAARHASNDISFVDSSDYYIYPHMPNESYRLGQILQKATDFKYFIVLTPHCQLYQNTKSAMKAEMVLLAPLISADVFFKINKVKEKKLSHWIKHPHDEGSPSGRYFFLPHFFEMPDMLADLHSVLSIPTSEVTCSYHRFAMLDTPYSEALQSQFIRLFSSVGVPALNPVLFRHIAYFREVILTIGSTKMSIKDVPKDYSEGDVQIAFCKSKKTISESLEWKHIQNFAPKKI
ncbi:MAG: hypothetical protein RDU30_17350 [Desulfovibrionaceae bacterium]|nr:hypothetical protein [Desulfovibrionaceae bacterium]